MSDIPYNFTLHEGTIFNKQDTGNYYAYFFKYRSPFAS